MPYIMSGVIVQNSLIGFGDVIEIVRRRLRYTVDLQLIFAGNKGIKVPVEVADKYLSTPR